MPCDIPWRKHVIELTAQAVTFEPPVGECVRVLLDWPLFCLIPHTRKGDPQWHY